MDMSQYMEIFIEESNEHLQHMNQIMLELENKPDDLSLLNEVFRIAHTIKGMAGTMGFNKVANLTHEMENVLQLVRSKEIEVSEKIVDILFECFDSLEEYTANLSNTGEEGELDSTELVNKLKLIEKNRGFDTVAATETDVDSKTKTPKAKPGSKSTFFLDIADISESLISKAAENGFNALKVKIIISESCMLKAARAFIVFNTLEQFGEIIKSYPIAEDIEDENFEHEFELLFITKLDEEATNSELMRISEITEVIIEKVDTEAIMVEEETEESQEEIIKEQIDEKVIEEPKEELNLKASSTKKEAQPKAAKKGKTSKTVRVDINRLDNLMNLVSELIIIKTRLEDKESIESTQNMNEAVEYLERITTSLHDAVMKVRMVPVERVFNRFPRMVRDLAKDLGKGINLSMSGEETEVDRTVIDEIGDPLIHLIRNSIDHGVESMEDRKKKGKPEVGKVDLRAYPDGNTVVIEHERIAEIALGKGLVTRDEVEAMSQNELVLLLFKPGFSTVHKVTDLSGRGVGLDVVKSKIESLGGIVEVQSEIGKGTKFIIRLPLTLAIIQALMVNLGDEKYALPLKKVKGMTTIKSDMISRVQDQEVVLYRNATLPILRLPAILGVPNKDTEEKTELTVVIIRKGLQEAGVVVDSLIGQQEIVIKSLGKYLGGVHAVAGATILGNGSVALIIDPNQLF